MQFADLNWSQSCVLFAFVALAQLRGRDFALERAFCVEPARSPDVVCITLLLCCYGVCVTVAQGMCVTCASVSRSVLWVYHQIDLKPHCAFGWELSLEFEWIESNGDFIVSFRCPKRFMIEPNYKDMRNIIKLRIRQETGFWCPVTISNLQNILICPRRGRKNCCYFICENFMTMHNFNVNVTHRLKFKG